MQTVEIHTSPVCGFCRAARRLPTRKGVGFAKVDVSRAPDKRPNKWQETMRRANGGYTVPQIFAGDTRVGGCDVLYALERLGKPGLLPAG